MGKKKNEHSQSLTAHYAKQAHRKLKKSAKIFTYLFFQRMARKTHFT